MSAPLRPPVESTPFEPPLTTRREIPPERSTIPPGRATAPSGRSRVAARRRGVVVLLVVVILVAAGAGATAGYVVARNVESAATAEVTAEVAGIAYDVDTVSDIGAIVESLERSVVSISTTTEISRGPFLGESAGAGTGIVIDDSGLVLTNAHVVEGATTTQVVLDGDDDVRAATVIASDSASDIAVLQVSDTDGLDAIEIPDTSDLGVGDALIAIGNALDLDGTLTVTSGIVSAVDRSIDLTDGSLDGLIQTDAAISSGNSGGPLVDSAGRVVGINTAVAASQGTTQASNIGFAIPIDTALAVAERLVAAA